MDRHNLAVMFRTLDSNLGHVSTFDAMQECGMGFIFGHFMSIPKKHRVKRRKVANNIADSLESKDGAFNYSKADPAKLMECIECLHGVVKDVLPQIGGIVLQDYARLNRGLILAREIGFKD